ncbi:MAG: MerR family transcriptional regulator [Myxococcales bacterium]|nr:MerR family transcriptional regulator [Myxococcales bacterium]
MSSSDRKGEAQKADPAPGLLRIHAVARATGISPHALRIWERRYGNMASQRSAAGYRLYTSDDLDRIRLIKDLLDQGHSIGDIAVLTAAELSGIRRHAAPASRVASPEVPLLDSARDRFLAAVDRLDPGEAERALSAAGLAVDPFTLVTQVIAPLLVEIGEAWRAGRLTIAHEHAASAAVRGHLAELLRNARADRAARLFVCTTPDGEQHELGVMMAAVVLATAGARAVYLGPSLPAADIAYAVKQSRAHAVVLSALALEPLDARRELARIRRAVPAPVGIFAGGASVLEPVPPGVTHLTGYDALVSAAALS